MPVLLIFYVQCFILRFIKKQSSVWSIFQSSNQRTYLSHKVTIIFFLLFLFGGHFSNGQDNKKVDSLKAVLNEQSPEEQFTTLVNLTIEYVDKDNNASLDFIEQAWNKGIALHDTAKIVKAGRIKGQLLRRLDRLDEAKTIFLKLLPVAKRNNLTNDYKVMLHSLAIAYSDMANYDKALEYNFQSLLIREAEGDKSEISISLDNIGRVYLTLNDYQKAIDYFLRSLKIKEQLTNPYGMENTLINIGHCYNDLKLFDKAQEYIYKGLKTCGGDCTPEVASDGESGLGFSYYGRSEFKEAREHFSKSFEIAKRSNNKRFQIENLLMLGKITANESNYSMALEYFTEGEKLAQEGGYNKLLINLYKEFSLVYKLQENYEEASYYQDKYIHLKDSILSESLIKNLAAVQTKFEQRENIKTIASRDEELSQQRQLIIAVGIIAVLAGLLIFMLFQNNKAKRKANDRLDQEVQAATKDLEIANKLLGEVNKELDHFIYKTSHDIRGPLASLKGLCNVAITDVKDPLAIDYFTKLDFTATHLDTLLRRLQKINQINHDDLKLQRIDFKDMLNELEILEVRKGLPERFEIRQEIEADINFISDREYLFLILENLMDNAIKFHNNSHSVSPFVVIKVVVNGESLVISVIDNGIGIGQAKPEELFQMFVRASERSVSGGIGLYISRRATERLGGEIHMRTTPEGYTEFYVSFPLKATLT